MPSTTTYNPGDVVLMSVNLIDTKLGTLVASDQSRVSFVVKEVIDVGFRV